MKLINSTHMKRVRKALIMKKMRDFEKLRQIVKDFDAETAA